ncbi:MAG TPA: transcription-repair coupling factor [Lacunisphaera sp.]|jgi:transcription-repair coupling factor (superfamily II helicase)|nr:transcription-repair coupling factor [Lacunisphaera sp.]
MDFPSAVRTKVTGVCPAARAFAVAALVRREKAPAWLVLHEETQQADALAEDLRLFQAALGADAPVEIVTFPEAQTDSRDLREAFTAASDRLAVLSKLRGPRPTPLVILATPAALLQPVPAAADFAAREVELRRGDGKSFAGLVELLRSFDYDSEAVCEAPGQYAVRGGIVDVYPITASHPCRLDFFGDMLEEIRALDPVSQRSGDQLDHVVITAAPKLHATAAAASLLDYLAPASAVVLLEPAAIEQLLDTLAGDDQPGLLERLPRACARLFGVSDLDLASRLFDGALNDETWDTESLAHHRSYPAEHLLAHERLQAEEDARRDFLEKVAVWRREGYEIDFVVSMEGEERRVREWLEQTPSLRKIRPRWLRGALNEGFRITCREGRARTPLRADDSAAKGLAALPGSTGRVVVSETEIFGRRRTRRPLARRAVATPSAVDQLLDFSELVEGDFVVHLGHGIALFRGLTKLESADGVREVISLEFEDKVTLHVPLQESHLISRYVGLSKARPQLGRVGSGRWEKARQSAERATLDLASEMLAIQAKREAQPGHAFAPDNDWQREFEAAFPFTETPDQAKAIVELKADMERSRPMDRLLCGDVGFGKTEVAVRGAFKAVMGGRQVAVLVPTTVLAQQHLNTFRERMAGYPVAVEMISRFRTAREQKEIVEAVAAGRIDILIGTHRLIQADMKFKDLGLVIIDEEQRFGVKHKEVFKRWRAHVDLLSMSATPIPRTLYLALTGARDLSTIETPPANRLPIQTIVKSYDEKLVVEAIQHEVRRGGQVFYLHNRVRTIDVVAARLRELLPDLAIGVGHGKMGSEGLERTMTDFVAGKYQVLVCTTIIESGLDIPNCNTLIIEGADRFGLSQLYQLRGRVGRFKHQAYAYLLLHRHTRLLDIARQRLGAIRQHNQLGAGFRIAMRDLELRGAGNLLGAEQSGQIVGVGFELYCQLLRQSVARLKGEKHAARIRAAVKLDFVFVGEGAEAPRREAGDSFSALKRAERTEGEIDRIQARLPAAYIAETRLRIDVYRRLALAENPKQVKEIEAELRDRFGKFGDEVRALLLATEIRVRAEQKDILSVETEGNRLKCLRNSGRRDDFIQLSSRFPRLTAPTPLARLKEVITFLINLPST